MCREKCSCSIERSGRGENEDELFLHTPNLHSTDFFRHTNPNTQDYDVKAIYLVSDMLETPITPGLLCREYLCEACPRLDVGILIATRDLKKKRWTKLRDLWPCPSLYTHLNAREIHSKTVLKDRSKMVVPKSYQKLHKILSDLVARKRDDDGLHPIQYVAGIELKNGTIIVEPTRKGLEYGTSLDDVSAMLPAILSSASRPLRGLRLDHFGVCHAPCAVARARLFEEPKCDALQFLVHVVSDKKNDIILQEIALEKLAPDFPKWRGGCSGCAS